MAEVILLECPEAIDEAKAAEGDREAAGGYEPGLEAAIGCFREFVHVFDGVKLWFG